jgi:hypothetical protein
MNEIQFVSLKPVGLAAKTAESARHSGCGLVQRSPSSRKK